MARTCSWTTTIEVSDEGTFEVELEMDFSVEDGEVEVDTRTVFRTDNGDHFELTVEQREAFEAEIMEKYGWVYDDEE